MKDKPAHAWTTGIIKQHLADSSRVLAELTASMVYDNVELLKPLIEVSLLDEDPWSQRASRVIRICGCRFPELFRPHCSPILKRLNGIKSEGVVRNFLRIIEDNTIHLTKKDKSILLNLCFDYLTGNFSVALKVYSMQILYNLSLDIPEIGAELSRLIEQNLPDSSPGYRSRGEKILKKLHRNSFR